MEILDPAISQLTLFSPNPKSSSLCPDNEPACGQSCYSIGSQATLSCFQMWKCLSSRDVYRILFLEQLLVTSFLTYLSEFLYHLSFLITAVLRYNSNTIYVHPYKVSHPLVLVYSQLKNRSLSNSRTWSSPPTENIYPGVTILKFSTSFLAPWTFMERLVKPSKFCHCGQQLCRKELRSQLLRLSVERACTVLDWLLGLGCEDILTISN